MIKEILLKDSLFGILDKNQIELIINNSSIKSSGNGEMLFNPTKNCRSFIFVLSGLLSITKILSTGKEISIGVIEKNVLFGEACVFMEEKYPTWIKAIEDSQVMEIPKNIILDNFSNRLFLNEFLKKWSAKIFRLQKKIEIISFKTIKQKIVYYCLTEVDMQSSCMITLGKTKTQIAMELDCTREALSRTFHKLESDGLIISESKSKLIIPSVEKLENLLYDLN